MLQLVEVLGLPFLACIIMGTILGYFGTHVLKREVIFIDIALAQVAAIGPVVAHLAFGTHQNSLLSQACSLALVLSVAAFYAVARTSILEIPLEAIIGISYAVAAATALFLVGIAPGGHEHIQQILSGSLLWTSRGDVIVGLLVFSAIGLCLYLVRKPLARISEHYREAGNNDIKVVFWDFIFYVLLGVVITLSVQIAGIVVVFAFLIIPATISAIFSSRLGVQLVIIWTVALAGSIAGLLFAYHLDFSVGPAVALFLGVELIIAGVIGKCGGVVYRQA